MGPSTKSQSVSYSYTGVDPKSEEGILFISASVPSGDLPGLNLSFKHD